MKGGMHMAFFLFALMLTLLFHAPLVMSAASCACRLFWD